MRISSLLIMIATLLVMVSCDKEELDPNAEPELPIPIVIPNGSENYLNDGSDYIFDQNKLHTFELKIPDRALAKLDENPTVEVYVEGMLIFEGDTISPVGIRYKGSVGAWIGCVSGSDWLSPSGSKTCTKLSMKIKINWDGREEQFFKVKKLQFHSMNNDPTQMHERLGYWLFREMGVPAPRSVHAKLNINGQYGGLFALTENIDSRFIKENYDDDNGNLYKEIWPLSMYGVPYLDDRYIAALKTNEDDIPNVTFIKDVGRKIAQADSSTAQNIVEQFMDIDEIISYAVVDRTIRHDDGPFHWYCNRNNCSSHNYFWYEEPNEEKLHLIPWDLDLAFANIISAANSITPIADEWGETSNNCQAFQYLDGRQRSAACDKLTAIWASYTDKYEQKRLELINGPMSEIAIQQMLFAWQDQIKNATKEASEKHSDAISVDEWESAIIDLKNQLEFARIN